MRKIIFHKETKTFHLYNDKISYILCVLDNGHLGQLYFGKRIHDKADFSYLVEKCGRPMTSYIYEWDRSFSLEHIRQEYPVYGTTDYRHPAIELLQENGSRISEFQYDGYEISSGKPKLSGLPATYTEAEEEAQTLRVFLKDSLTGAQLELLYTIFEQYSAIARSARLKNSGNQNLHILNMMSLSLDLPDKDYIWMQLSGAWSRERYVKNRVLEQGITAIDSMRGNSSHEHNPFMVLKRENTDENVGEAIGVSLIYSGNFRIQAEVDTHDVTRITAGINPTGFDWKLEPMESFQTPEAMLVYSDQGLNGMSQTFQKLYAKRLARGYWRDRTRPILNNNWEATYFDFNEDKLINICKKASELGIELFVLDDGWFGKRNNDKSSLGDWFVNTDKLPGSLKGLSEKVDKLGMSFGLWVEPEMISEDSDLFRKHPDWALRIQGREMHEGRNQYVLDMGRDDVVAYLTDVFTAVLGSADIKYIKWDMNRNISDANSAALPPNRQGEVMHRYILGVYKLMENLVSTFPNILFEGCSGGAGRNDPGILYYMPQNWGSDNTDAVERMYIQYGAGMVYPSSTICAHVSDVPNHQVGRTTPMKLRSEVAMSAVMGYEFDLSKLTDDECYDISEQIKQYKRIRSIVCFGDLYRLINPFENRSASWMYVSEDKTKAVVFYYNKLAKPNSEIRRLKLKGLDEGKTYIVDNKEYTGRTLMNFGLYLPEYEKDFESRAWEIEEKK